MSPKATQPNQASVAPRPAQSTVKDVIMNPAMQRQFAMALPKICTPDRFIRVALTAINKNPKLMNCTKESVLGCLMKCAELGLEPDGRRAHLIPYKDHCTVIIDYKGKAELAMRSGTVANIHADKICENDLFEYDRGSVKKHTIDFKKDRGKAYAYYTIIHMKDGTEKAEVMTLKEIDAIKERSAAWRYFKSNGVECPWNTDFDEMAKKTVFHRASKWITLSPELRASEDLDDEDPAASPIRLELPAATPVEATATGEPEAPAPEGLEGMAASAETDKEQK